MKELDKKTVRVNQHYESHTWVAGHHPELGEMVHGWTGQETLIKRTIVKPIVTFNVNNINNNVKRGDDK